MDRSARSVRTRLSPEVSGLIRQLEKRNGVKHHLGSLIPVSVVSFVRNQNENRRGTGLSPLCCVTIFVRTDIVDPCPPDMSGHVPDMIPDMKTGVFGRKTGPGRPDILDGHRLKSLLINTLNPNFEGFGYPHVRTSRAVAYLRGRTYRSIGNLVAGPRYTCEPSCTRR